MSYNLEEIKQIPIRELAKVLGLEVRGERGNASCFKHKDRFPSLGFDSKKNMFKCFSCGISGSPIDLVMEKKEITSGEAIRWLAEHYGINAANRQEQVKREAKVGETTNNDPTQDDHELYKDFYGSCSSLDSSGIAFLRAKGFTDETISYFGWRTITNGATEMAKRRTERARLSGIESVLRPGWWLIPYFDEDKIVYLTARNPTTSADGRAGQRFSHVGGKSTQLYNLNALCAITDRLYVAEGQTDTMTLYQNGIPAVGISGASQQQSLERLARIITGGFDGGVKIITCFDTDLAGRNATEIARHVFTAAGIIPEALKIPANYKDINDYYNGVTKEV